MEHMDSDHPLNELNLSLLPLMKQRSVCNIYGNNSPSRASRGFFHFFPSETTGSHWLWFSQFSRALILIWLHVRPAAPLYRLWQRKKKKKQQLNTLGVSGSFCLLHSEVTLTQPTVKFKSQPVDVEQSAADSYTEGQDIEMQNNDALVFRLTVFIPILILTMCNDSLPHVSQLLMWN